MTLRMRYFVCVFLMVAIFIIDLLIPLGVAGGVPYVLVILLTLWLPLKGVTVGAGVACTFLTVAGYFYSPEGGVLWQVLGNRLLAVFAIWVCAILGITFKKLQDERAVALAERNEALEQVKVLKGLFPICASCKKIRDDNGFWTQIEAYIQEHSEAEFSHGICPECADKLYPELKKIKLSHR